MRARQVNVDYHRHARKLDARADVQAANGGSTGAVLAALNAYPPVHGLVWGHYGEASELVHELFNFTVSYAANKHWRKQGACRPPAPHPDAAAAVSVVV